jgi:hypothetical protein
MAKTLNQAGLARIGQIAEVPPQQLSLFAGKGARGSRRKRRADRLSAQLVPVAPVCRREFREPYKKCGLTDGQEEENIYEKPQGTHA